MQLHRSWNLTDMHHVDVIYVVTNFTNIYSLNNLLTSSHKTVTLSWNTDIGTQAWVTILRKNVS